MRCFRCLGTGHIRWNCHGPRPLTTSLTPLMSLVVYPTRSFLASLYPRSFRPRQKCPGSGRLPWPHDPRVKVNTPPTAAVTTAPLPSVDTGIDVAATPLHQRDAPAHVTSVPQHETPVTPELRSPTQLSQSCQTVTVVTSSSTHTKHPDSEVAVSICEMNEHLIICLLFVIYHFLILVGGTKLSPVLFVCAMLNLIARFIYRALLGPKPQPNCDCSGLFGLNCSFFRLNFP